jgi:hypothetical protein
VAGQDVSDVVPVVGSRSGQTGVKRFPEWVSFPERENMRGVENEGVGGEEIRVASDCVRGSGYGVDAT